MNLGQLPVTDYGVQAATIGAEHVLARATGSRIFVFEVDCGEMERGDVCEIRIKAVDDETTTLYLGKYVGSQVNWFGAEIPIKTSMPILNQYSELVCTLKQTHGIPHNYGWRVREGSLGSAPANLEVEDTEKKLSFREYIGRLSYRALRAAYGDWWTLWTR